MNSREFRQRLADLVARQRRAAYEGASEDPATGHEEAAGEGNGKVKTRRKKA